MSGTPSIKDLLPVIRSQISRIKAPHTHDKVYKDECVYSFDSPFTDTGLYVNLITYQGVGQRYLHIDAKKSNAVLYLHEKFHQIPRETSNESEEKQEITKLAIGVEGGFNTQKKYDIIEEYSLIILTENKESILATIPLPSTEIPEFITNVINTVIKHDGMKKNLAVTTWEADNEKIISKYAETLQQVNPNNLKISQDRKLWKDEASDATDNLWLNLSTGYIGGGRKNWDGTGGSGSALQHYIDTGRKYPLVVKLGTITPHGADVWSYAEDEDCLVIDPKLSEHLSFWGIDIMKLEKTEQTLSELEVKLNQTYDWSKIIEKNELLVPVTGPGFIGLRNIGSSCYLNSLLQVVLSLAEFQERYYYRHQEIAQTSSNDPSNDLITQLSKISFALFSDHYVPPLPQSLSSGNVYEESANDVSLLEKYVIAPYMLKHAIGKNHPEFSSGRQQDVSEFYLYFLDQLTKIEKNQLTRLTYQTGNTIPLTSTIFHYHLQTQYKELNGKGGVKTLKTGSQTLFNLLELPVPTEKAIPKIRNVENNEKEEDEKVDPETKRQRLYSTSNTNDEVELTIPFEACLEKFFEPELMEFQHPTLLTKQPFLRHYRFQTFPRYLVIKLARYYVTENWTQKKITAEVPMPLTLDLNQYRGHGLSHGEFELQESGTTSANTTAPAPAAAEFVVDEGALQQLMSMGFSENGCRRALIATRTNDAEVAMNWVFEHMEDPDFNEPPVTAPAATNTATSALPPVNEESVQMLTAMGYNTEQCTAALIATDNNIERAADWLFSHVEDLDAAVNEVFGRATASTAGSGSSGGDSGAVLDDGDGKYTLRAIISHIGKNTDHGHYVCHILKNGEWYFYNDEKVAKCEKPPLGFGFMYIYRRDDGPGTFFL